MLCSSQLLITGNLIQLPCEIPANIPYSHFQAYLHTNKYYKLVVVFFKEEEKAEILRHLNSMSILFSPITELWHQDSPGSSYLLVRQASQ